MRQVWVLSQVDYEDSVVLGVFSTLHLAEIALRVLWVQVEGLTPAQRALVLPDQLRHQDAVTWEAFQQAHPIDEWTLNSLTQPYSFVEPARTD